MRLNVRRDDWRQVDTAQHERCFMEIQQIACLSDRLIVVQMTFWYSFEKFFFVRGKIITPRNIAENSFT